jgi:PAS domain S-box-containing protein
MFGYAEEEAIGQPITIIGVPELYKEEGHIRRRLAAGERIAHYETVRVSKAGKRIDVSLTISPIKDEEGRIIGASKILRDITERKEAEEGKERFRSVFECSAVGMALVSCNGRWIKVNRALCEMLGYSEQELLATNFQSLTHPDDLEADLSYAQKVFTGQLRFYHMEKRYIHKQGHVVWVRLTASAVPDASGKVSYSVAQVQDITATKNAEEALRQDQEQLQNLAGRLITVQEEERKRIARELHDDINQRLALLAVRLDGLNLPDSAHELRREVGGVRQEVEDLLTDIQALSHLLHSSKLDYLGLAAAAAGFCKEFSDLQKMEIDFRAENVPEDLSPEISLCLFRALQEALRNAVKHGGARHVQVSLRGGAGEIELTVHDSGIGFEPKEAIIGRGLGLSSMKERLKLVDGQLSIDSKLQHGTTIQAWVPLGSNMRSAGASG